MPSAVLLTIGVHKTAGSFANSLYENYIKPAQAAGTTVVLCTPIVRRTADGNWSDSQLHVTAASGELVYLPLSAFSSLWPKPTRRKSPFFIPAISSPYSLSAV